MNTLKKTLGYVLIPFFPLFVLFNYLSAKIGHPTEQALWDDWTENHKDLHWDEYIPHAAKRFPRSKAVQKHLAVRKVQNTNAKAI